MLLKITMQDTQRLRPGFLIIGLSSRRLLLVIFAEEIKDKVRIISARKATRAERKLYEGRIIR